jgi:uncharacterized membrane protein YcaP (DUF421 family)
MSLPDFGSSLPEVALRTGIIYVFLVALLRLAGKREVGQLSILELVSVLVISDAVQNGMVGENTTIWGGMVAATTLVLAGRGFEILRDRSTRFRKVVEGEPRLLVREGRALSRAMREEGIQHDELMAAIRSHGLTSVEEVRLAVLETDGSISVVPAEGSSATQLP